MAFLRTKNIDGKKYAYLVENKWTSKGPRQKTLQYIGRIYTLKVKKELAFAEFYSNYSAIERSFHQILLDIVRFELTRHGFKNKAKLWEKDDCKINTETYSFTNDNQKNIALQVNDGILCKFTMKRILNHKKSDERVEKEGYMLAKLLLEAGLPIPKEIFITMYAKL